MFPTTRGGIGVAGYRLFMPGTPGVRVNAASFFDRNHRIGGL
jgi:hypothetical protein